jgi:uncharacterized alkaline shock family protein YloU
MAHVERVTDITVASAVALAVRTVPGVMDLSPGLSTPVATYGAGRRVTGIVVHHPTPDDIALEVHVVLSEAHCTAAPADATVDSTASDARDRGVLADIASQIRELVFDTVHDVASLVLVRVDVFMDDLR